MLLVEATSVLMAVAVTLFSMGGLAEQGRLTAMGRPSVGAPKPEKKVEKFSVTPGLEQINGDALIEAGLSGKGVKIGVIDVGFSQANKDTLLAHIFRNSNLMGTHDYVYTQDKNVFASHTGEDWHGTTVWQLIGGKSNKNLYYGLATDASFFLARTDNAEKEYRAEQENFKAALKWFKSKGVRLVHASIGYSYGFDDPKENYVPEEMNGKTAPVTKAVQEAILNDNMIVIASAGNEGNSVWKIISAPADAEGVITVGATDLDNTKRDFSSEGPDFIPYLKPTVSCFNHMGGTSFAAPVITGLVACILQKKPGFTGKQVMEILMKSGHLYPYGNNYLGYGVPDAERVLQLLDNPDHDFKRNSEVKSKTNVLTLPAEANDEGATIHHKMDKWVVLKQEEVKYENGQLVVTKPPPQPRSKLVVDDKANLKFHVEESLAPVTRSTIITKNKVIEVFWP